MPGFLSKSPHRGWMLPPSLCSGWTQLLDPYPAAHHPAPAVTVAWLPALLSGPRMLSTSLGCPECCRREGVSRLRSQAGDGGLAQAGSDLY